MLIQSGSGEAQVPPVVQFQFWPHLLFVIAFQFFPSLHT